MNGSSWPSPLNSFKLLLESFMILWSMSGFSSMCLIAGNAGNLFFWIGAGTYRDAGDIEMTNLFVGLAFLWIGLGALLIVLIGYVLTKFRNLVFESSTGHENLVKVVKKITFQMGLFGMIGINTILGG